MKKERVVRLGVSLALAAVVVAPIVYLMLDTGAQVVVDRAAGQARIGGAAATGADLSVNATVAVARAAPKPPPVSNAPQETLELPASGASEFTNEHALRYQPGARTLEAFAELRRTCAYWTRKVDAGTATAGEIEMQRAACQRMHDFAGRTGLEAPDIALAAPLRGEPDRVVSRVKVRYRTCEELAYGSIDYRRCRAEQKAVLDRKCKTAREHARRAGGSPDYPRLNDVAEAWCVAHFNYDIVR